MKVVLQRVTEAAVLVGDRSVGAIGHGLLALVGVSPEDSSATVDWMADKIVGLRIFADEHKPMNRSVLDVGGAVLVVSQFTLSADTRRGKRPSFTSAAAPELARQLYEQLVTRLAEHVPVATGEFGADMQVKLINDGPVTFVLESPPQVQQTPAG